MMIARSYEDFVGFVNAHKPSCAIAVLFGGDRFSCVTEAFVAKEGGEIVGVCTVAEKGEQNSGQPAIVGLWAAPLHRG